MWLRAASPALYRAACGPLFFVCVYSVYMPRGNKRRDSSTPRKAKIFMNNRSQAVRLPKEFQFKVAEVFIRRLGNDVPAAGLVFVSGRGAGRV
jgi:hypothetical protein